MELGTYLWGESTAGGGWHLQDAGTDIITENLQSVLFQFCKSFKL